MVCQGEEQCFGHLTAACIRPLPMKNCCKCIHLKLRGGLNLGLFQIYRSLGIDGSLIGFTDSEIAVPHFCYPVNATAIGFEGCILYCFLPECGEMVFASNPESCAETYVYPLAETFEDFMPSKWHLKQKRTGQISL